MRARAAPWWAGGIVRQGVEEREPGCAIEWVLVTPEVAAVYEGHDEWRQYGKTLAAGGAEAYGGLLYFARRWPGSVPCGAVAAIIAREGWPTEATIAGWYGNAPATQRVRIVTDEDAKEHTS
jgi:hypothetical protein